MGTPTTVIDQAEIANFARKHQVAESQIRIWASEGQGFPQEYLRTHGVVNYATFLQITAFYIARRAAGESFAQANAATATALTGNNTLWTTQQDEAKTTYNSVGTN